MAKKKTEEIVVKSKFDLYQVVQRYLANHATVKKLDAEMKKQSAAIKKAREKFKLPKGPAEEFDGPNGGITFGCEDREQWCAEAIKKYLGIKTYKNSTEVKVKSGSKEHLRNLMAQMIEEGELFRVQADEIYHKTGETIKLIAIPARTKDRDFEEEGF